MKFIQDPVTELPSVSLTLLIATFVGVMLVGAAEVAGFTKTTSIFSELFYSSAALYFGRRFSFGGKSYTSDKAEQVENKIEKKEEKK